MQNLLIIPYPQKIEISDKILTFDGFCIVADPSVKKFAHDIPGNCPISVEFSLDPTLGKEEYTLLLDASGGKIRHSTDEGAFRAYSTLVQIALQSKDGVPCVKITDYPNLKNRGYMLDISRGKIPTLEYLKKLVDLLAVAKYNQFQLYMENFCFEYKNFPDYWKTTDPLSAKEILELKQYCADRFITLVPNQNGFGHMGTWLEKDELKPLGITRDDGKPTATLNPFLSKSIELVDKIYDGYLELFDADTVNIGMDEPMELGMGETKQECEKRGVGPVYIEYLNKICKLVSEKYGKTPMFWADIVFHHPELLDTIDRNAIFLEWGYELEQNIYMERHCKILHDLGLRFYVCPGTSLWNSATGRSYNAVHNISLAAETAVFNEAEGLLLTEWGNMGNMQFPAMTFFHVLYGGDCAWHSSDSDVYNRRQYRGDEVDHCIEYLDRFVFHSKNGSLARLIYRAGYYYSFEDQMQWDCNQLMRQIVRGQPFPPEAINAIELARDYMLRLRPEFDKVECEPLYKRQAILDCDIVIFFARVGCGESGVAITAEGKRILAEFEYLWKLDAHTDGIQIFEKMIKSFI